MQAEKSTHYIHLIQPELITGAVDMISREKEKGIKNIYPLILSSRKI